MSNFAIMVRERKNMKGRIPSCALAVVFLVGLCYADNQEIKVKTTGSAALEVGQIVQGECVGAFMTPENPKTVLKGWQERFLFLFGSDAVLNEHIRLIINIEGKIAFAYPQVGGLDYITTQAPSYVFSPIQAEGVCSLGDPEKPWLRIGMGFFPYKFNPDARNLGEFMFRSGTYPPYIITDFNHCYGRLLGLRVSSTLFNNLKQDLLFTSETLMFPTQDYSLSYLAHYSLAGFMDIGAGIDCAHFFSIGSKDASSAVKSDAVGDRYIAAAGDTATSYYDFKAVKPSIMLAFDLKKLLPSIIADLLSKDDLRLYGEACVTGWEDFKNYDTTANAKSYYENRMDRTLLMAGLNIPTTKWGLDVLSLECEYYSNKYPNSFRNVMEMNIATPYTNYRPDLYPWYFSIYAKKTFLDKFSITGQIARDHMRPYCPVSKFAEREESLKKIGDWWWVLNFNVSM
jgi:hypothetical protein